MKNKKIFIIVLILIVIVCSILALVSCGRNKEDKTDEVSVIEYSGGVTGDKELSDVSTIPEDIENDTKELVREMQNQNTKYSDRYANFRAELINENCTFDYTIKNNNTNTTDKYTYVNSADDGWYYHKVTESKGKKVETAYICKNDTGYTYDYNRKVCAIIPKERLKLVKTDILPVINGVVLSKQTNEVFNGVAYDCDIYDLLTGDENEETGEISVKKTGTVKVFYSDNKIVGIIIKDAINKTDKEITVNSYSKEIDDTLFITDKDGFTKVSVEEYLGS